jgi:carnitine 3-dehydrogenase
MKNEAGEELATGEQLMIHVDLTTRRSSVPDAAVLAKVEALAVSHAALPQPDKSELL